MKALSLTLAVLAGLVFTPAATRATSLDISPVFQETPVWCWVAVGEMVFDYFGVPNVNPGGDYQCGIIGLLAVGTWANACAYRCELCQVPAGSADGVIQMLRDYPRRVSWATAEEVPTLSARHWRRALTADELIDELEEGHPVIAGISPGGRPSPAASAAHVALIIGYRESEDGLELRVNDPYPYGGWQGNPYLAADGESIGLGSYWISYDRFRGDLHWTESFTVSEAASYRAPVGRSCCVFGGGSCGPFFDQPPLQLGAPCSCQYGNPYASGQVCR